MTHSEIKAAPTIAYYSGLNGIEIKGIEYGIEDYILFTSNAWTGKPTAHRTKVYYTATDNIYFKCNGYRIPLNECIRV